MHHNSITAMTMSAIPILQMCFCIEIALIVENSAVCRLGQSIEFITYAETIVLCALITSDA